MSNSNNATVYTNGGVTGVSFGTEADFEAGISRYDALNGDMGSGRVSVGGDGEILTETLGTTHVNMGQEISEQRANSTSILDTARTAWGTRPSQLTKDSIVVVGTTETTIAAALQLGLIKTDAQGNFVEVARGNQGQQPRVDQQAAAERADSSDYFPVPEANMTALNEVIADLPQVLYEQTLNKYLNFGPDSIDHRQLGQITGLDPSEVQQRIAFAAQVFQTHAVQSLKGVVGDPEEALAWLSENKPKELARAMSQVVHGHQVGELRTLARSYVRSTNPDASTLRNAGFETRTEKDGTEMLRYQGQWMSVRSAVNAGLI